jgi:hypothetical protein
MNGEWHHYSSTIESGNARSSVLVHVLHFAPVTGEKPFHTHRLVPAQFNGLYPSAPALVFAQPRKIVGPEHCG